MNGWIISLFLAFLIVFQLFRPVWLNSCDDNEDKITKMLEKTACAEFELMASVSWVQGTN